MSERSRMVDVLATALVLGLAYLFIYLPVASLVLFSFHEGKVPLPPFRGPTLDWYARVLSNGKLLAATGHSVLVGAVSAILATALGFLAAYGFARHRVAGAKGLELLLILPLTVSYLIIGIGLLVTFSAVGLPKSLVAVAIGHVVINLPLAFAICRAAMGEREARLERAARDLGASEWQVFRRVTVPLTAPALAAALALCFTLSWDEFVIAFLNSSFDVTLPVVIWSMLRTGLNPETNAAGTLVFLVSLTAVVIFELAQKREGTA
jgi:spermidine/putrescine transport system permease protein